jgi:hypothetical protein
MTDRIVEAARFLASQIEYSRHQLWVDELFAAIAAALAKIRFTVDGPNEQKYLGPCGAPTEECAVCQWDQPGHHSTCGPECPHQERRPGLPCEGDVYGVRGGSRGRCRACGAEVAQDDRQAWLDGEVRAHAFTAAQIAEAYGINVKTIRSWATDRAESRDHRGTLTRSATPARLRTHAVGRDGQALFLVGDVLDLAAADAARRETERAKRERRAAAKTAESEHAA